MRTSFKFVAAELIDTTLSKWSENHSDIMRWTEPASNLEVLIKILEVRGKMTIQALTEAYNSQVQSKYSATKIGRALIPLVKNGRIIKDFTRAKGVTINKTTIYEINKN